MMVLLIIVALITLLCFVVYQAGRIQALSGQYTDVCNRLADVCKENNELRIIVNRCKPQALRMHDKKKRFG